MVELLMLVKLVLKGQKWQPIAIYKIVQVDGRVFGQSREDRNLVHYRVGLNFFIQANAHVNRPSATSVLCLAVSSQPNRAPGRTSNSPT